ncbi:MAG: nucleotidyltransferase domain-containing protein [Nanoarchaeota archaeon]
MLINLLDKSIAKILLFLEISPGSRYLRKDIKEKTNLNNMPLDISLAQMLNFKMILFKDKLYSLNLDNNIVKLITEENREFKQLPLKIQFVILDFIKNISKLKGITKIILFGSYSKLIYTDKSDIDIAIVFDENEKNRDVKKKISLIVERLSRKHKKQIQEHFFSEKDLLHKEDALIKDIVRNGKNLL